ncbi:MAG: hypothetical protein H6702_20880 [Myxococcales bacterium]|nr:hypothetical protein [Myxococcales bacterium]
MRPALRPTLRALTVLACGLSGLVCAPPDDAPTTSAPAPVAGALAYHADWRLEGVTAHADGAWSVTNDLGHVITVTRGYLTTYSVELAECSDLDGATGQRGWLRSLLGGGVAHAGHDDVPNPVAMQVAQVETLVPLSPRQLGTAAVIGRTYCRAHYLVARAPEDALDLPNDVDMVATALLLEGTWQATPEAAPQPFAVRTSLANGRIAELVKPGDDTAFRLDTTAQPGARVTVWRDPARLFDGVDFGAMGDRAVQRALLTNLMDDLQITTTPVVAAEG